jgi:hypothetical protein
MHGSGRGVSRNSHAKRSPAVAAKGRRESLGAPIRASAITIRLLRPLSRRLCEKKFQRSKSPRRGCARMACPQKKFHLARAHRSPSSELRRRETLVPCGFLRNAKKRIASPKSSSRKKARAMNCIAVVRATRVAHAIIAHFLLTGFGVSCLLLYKLQRDARRIG